MPSTDASQQQQPMAVNDNSIVTEQPTPQSQPDMEPTASMRGGFLEECSCCCFSEECACC